MNGIRFVTDDKGRRVAVQLDLKKHRELWEDIEDVLISRSRRAEKRIPLEKVKASLVKAASSRGELPGFVGHERGKELSALPGKVIARIMRRIRVGDYRAVYEIDDLAKTVENNSHHPQARCIRLSDGTLLWPCANVYQVG